MEGIFYPFQVRTGLRLDPSQNSTAQLAGLTGTQLSAERDLGAGSRLYQGRIGLMVRMRERSRVLLSFEEVNRNSSQVLARDIQFGDQSFLAGDRVDTLLQFRNYSLIYTYSLYRSDQLEIGTGLGAHLVEARVRGVMKARGQVQDESGAAGCPTIPLDITWRFAPKFSVSARAEYFKANIGDFSGSLLGLHGDVQYRWTPNVSVGVGYTLQRIAVNLKSSDFSGNFSLDTRGETAFFRMSL